MIPRTLLSCFLVMACQQLGCSSNEVEANKTTSRTSLSSSSSGISNPPDSSTSVSATSISITDSSLSSSGMQSSSTSGSLLIETIGPAGGTVQAEDHGLIVEVPAGALDVPTAISIQAMSNPPPGAMGTVYEIGPSGTRFTMPVSISIRVDDSIPDPLTAIVATRNELFGKWELLASGTSTSGSQRFISGLTSHFSIFGVVDPGDMNGVWGCEPRAGPICPDGYYMSWAMCLAQFELVSEKNPCRGSNEQVLCLPMPITAGNISVCSATGCPQGYNLVESRGATARCGAVPSVAGCDGWKEYICSSASSGTLSEIWPAFRKAWCDHQSRCANTQGAHYSTKEACLRDDYHRYLPIVGKPYLQWMDDNFVIDTAKMNACIAKLQTVACEDDATECNEALSAKTAIPVGQPCEFFGPCEGAAECRHTTDDCSICVNPKPDDADCTSGYECKSRKCQEDKCTAVISKGINEACADWGECKGNLDCVGPNGNRKCASRVGLGAECGSEHPSCYEDLTCVKNRCTSFLDDGTVCKRDLSTGICDSYCVFGNSSATEGTCQSTPAGPEGDPPCGLSGIFFVYFCEDSNMYADAKVGETACTCRMKKDDGADCTPLAYDDYSRYYSRLSQCTSGYCDPTTNKCAPLVCQ